MGRSDGGCGMAGQEALTHRGTSRCLGMTYHSAVDLQSQVLVIQLLLELLRWPPSKDIHCSPILFDGCTSKIRMWVGDHSELISFLVIAFISTLLILGIPGSGSMIITSPGGRALPAWHAVAALHPPSRRGVRRLRTLRRYHLPSKSRVSKRPPHWPYDMAINLLPRAVPPRGQQFALSPDKTPQMEAYI